jgi:hypothetical protein
MARFILARRQVVSFNLLGGRQDSQSIIRWYGNGIPGFRIQAGDAWAIGFTTRLDAPEYHGGLLQSVRG